MSYKKPVAWIGLIPGWYFKVWKTYGLTEVASSGVSFGFDGDSSQVD